MTEHSLETDILVIGGGLAGSYAAIKAKEMGAGKVLLLDKAHVGKSGCSTFAAGVMTVWFPGDDFDSWLKEIVVNGEYMNHQEWTRILLADAHERIYELESWGIEFEKENGKFARKLGRAMREEGHLRNIMFHGNQMMWAIRKMVLKSDVEVVNRVMVTDLLKDGDRVVGAVGLGVRTGDFFTFKAKATILAAGGTSYKCAAQIGHKNLTGDAHAMGYRAGAEIMNFEFGSNNTSPKLFDAAGMNMLVGLGARFVNARGEAFMDRYDPLYRDRGTMSRIAGAMAMEVKQGRGPIYLDMTSFTPKDVALLRKVLPLTMKAYDDAKVDILKEKIEWTVMPPHPFSHGGGAKIDTYCRTNVPGLFAVGDASHMMSHGADCSGALNLPFCCVSGARAAKGAQDYLLDVPPPKTDEDQVQHLKERAFVPLRRRSGVLPDRAFLRIQQELFPYQVCQIKEGKRLEVAMAALEAIREEELEQLYAADSHELMKAHEAENMWLSAEILLKASLARTESRGSNIREDYPYTDNENWLKWVLVYKGDDGAMEVNTEDIPIAGYPVKPEKARYLHPIFAHKEESRE